MGMGERKGTISYDVKNYIESHLVIDWESPDSNKDLQEEFPQYTLKQLNKNRNKYLHDYKRDILKKFSYEEILEVRKIMKWWQKYASDPLNDLLPQKDEMKNNTYGLSVLLTEKIRKIAEENGLNIIDIVSHSLERFVKEYEANKQRQMNAL